MEGTAGRVYEKAALYYSGRKDIFEFVRHLAYDERAHGEIIGRIEKEFLVAWSEAPLAAYLPEEEMRRIEGQFLMIERGVDQKTLTVKELLEHIVESEYSEWNDLFLYVIASVRIKREFVPAAVTIQKHKRFIEKFISGIEGTGDLVEKIRAIPHAWEEKVLAVDDEKMITDVVKAVLAGESRVDSASNGIDALRMIEQNYYAVIISDLDMPGLDGIALFKEAVKRYPGMRKRFIFFSGEFSTEAVAFLRQNQIRFFTKPASITVLKKAVLDILSFSPRL